MMHGVTSTPVQRAPELNWSGTYAYRASVVHRPTSVTELLRLVTTRPALHALGTRHSFNDVADAAELVSVADLPGAPVLDPGARTVRVPAAMRYGDLAVVLQRAGWALGSLASLPHISVAGSVATATHGSGSENQSLSAAVRGLTLVTSAGEVLELDHGSPDFDGAVVHLGALGVVTEVTLAVEPTFDVRQDVYLDLPWDSLVGDFDAVMAAGYSVSAITDFAADAVHGLWVKSRLRDGEPARMPAELFGARAATEKQHFTAGSDPSPCTPQLGVPGPWCDRLPHFLLDFTPSTGAEIQSEFLMHPRHAPAALQALRGLGHRIAPLVFSAEIRTVAADDLWLSPAHRQECFGVHFTWRPDEAAVRSVLAEIEAALAPFAPRPHWGKVFTGSYDWDALYPRLADFRRLVAEHDPRGVFRNAFLERTVLA